MARRPKNPNALSGKVYLGTSLMSSTQGLTAALMSSFFMLYLTDYSGLGAYAATLGSSILVFARIFDAVNDPLEGYIIDRAKPGKNGKYRPFTWLATIMMTIGVIGLFWIPEAIVNSPVIVSLYVIGFYLLYDIGYSFFVPELVYRTISLDPGTRGKMLIGPRMVVMIWGMVCSSLIAIVAAINSSVGNLHTSFGITVAVFCGIAALLSIVGTLFFKEKYIPEKTEDTTVKFTDLLTVFKENKAFRVRTIGAMASGFIYTMMYATTSYYAKWAYCADLTTGAVDQEKFGLFTLIISMISFSPLILGTLLGGPIMKALKTPNRASIVLVLGQGIPLGVLFILQILGILPSAPILFFVCLVISSFAVGASYIPVGVMNMEIMDYDQFTTGKQRPGLMNAVTKLLEKAQQALATAVVGILLASVGYIVDEVSGNFVGDLATMPSLLNWFAVIFGLIPLVLAIIFAVVHRNYPITNEIRAEMDAKLKNNTNA